MNIDMEKLFKGKDKKEKRNITFYITQDTINKLERMSKNHNISKSLFIANMIDMIFEKNIEDENIDE